jgi:GLPGLI family protein
MKRNNLKSLMTFVLVVMGSAAITAAKPFEGVINYKITYPDSKYTEAQMNMFPKVMTVSVKGSMARTEMNVGGGTTVEIVDYVAKTKIALINMMGQKYAIKQTSAEIEKENADQPKGAVTITNETKNIAGYTCKKAIVTINDDGVKSTLEVWFTEELGGKDVNFDNPMYKDINGVLLEFSIKTPQITMRLSASSIEKKSIAQKDFEIPADFTITTQEELKSKFGGGQ